MKPLRIRGEADPAGAAPAASPIDGRLPIRRFKFELALVVLLLFTFALIKFQDLFATQTISLRPDYLSNYVPYWYNDSVNGGRSAITVARDRPLRWSCELRPGYEYPFCGYGILIDSLHTGRGLDLRGFRHVVIRLRYNGPGKILRMNFARTDPLKGASSTLEPGEISFPVVQGEQTVRLNLDEIGLPVWWALKNHADVFSHPPRDNITAIELQPGKGAGIGRHDFDVQSVAIEGRQISQAQIYLGLLVLWVTLVSLFLLHRVLGIRREFERRQALQALESEALQRAKAAAESASAAKSAFLANMSHELRTPLNAILGYAQLLEHEPLTERQAAAARTIHRSGAHLLTLITDILDLSKIEAGRAELSPAPLDLHACIAGVAEMMMLRASEKGLAFDWTIGPDVPRFILGDERRLRQVTINLLGNAIKFTPAGRVSLRVSRATEGEAQRLRIDVSDTGPGIGADQLSRIFEPFEQLGDSERQSGGTGLGLTISREIVELMGGRIEVESEEGRGSRFGFEIPLVEAEEPGFGIDGGVGRRLIVIDPDAGHRALLTALTAELGFAAIPAADGREGIAAAITAPPDLVLVRAGAPGTDPAEAIAALRRTPGLERTPIVAFSADSEAEPAAIAAGADRFIPAPLTLAELVALLSGLLPQRVPSPTRGPAAVAAGEEMVPPPPGELQTLLTLALAGNMRAIRAFADDLVAARPEYAVFADRLKVLAAGYQSPAILELVSRYITPKEVA